jgi:putative membrane protein
MMWGDGWWGLGMGIVWLVFLGLVVGGIVLAVRGSSGGATDRGRERSALDILDERFARGEIDRDEYEERRRVLRDSQRS